MAGGGRVVNSLGMEKPGEVVIAKLFHAATRRMKYFTGQTRLFLSDKLVFWLEESEPYDHFSSKDLTLITPLVFATPHIWFQYLVLWQTMSYLVAIYGPYDHQNCVLR